MKPEVLNLRSADDPRDIVHRVVERLAQGGLVALPTETVYVVAASVVAGDAVERLSEIASSVAQDPITLAIKTRGEARDWVPQMTTLGRRLARRLWPGPVSLVFDAMSGDGLLRQLPEPAARRIGQANRLSLWVPMHAVVVDCQRLLPWPLVVTSASRSSQEPAATSAQAIENVGDCIDLVADDGPCRYGQPSSVVRVHSDRWEMVREGVVTEAAIRRLARSIILFVCTGNTCRSPMAEGLCRMLIAKKLGCAPGEVGARGFEILSAGVSAYPGESASPEAVQAVNELGVDISKHHSRLVSAETIEQADYVFAMTERHARQLAESAPGCADRIRLVRSDGGSVSDPFGLDLAAYRRTAAEIEANLRQLIDELVP